MALTGGAAFSAAFLAACGGGSDDSSGGADKPDLGIATAPVDTSSQAKKGGTLKDMAVADPVTLDLVSPISAPGPNSRAYSTLVVEKPGHLSPAAGELGPDIAQSWEKSPDGLQITLKLRPGVKFHNKAPVNGRAMDIDDVLFSWKRFAAKSSNRGNVDNVANPEAPVLSITATDASTIVMKLKEPLVYALHLFASYGGGGHVTIVPKETDTTFDIRNDMIGTGPYSMSSYTPSVGFQIKRNPEYYDKDFANFDQAEYPVITEYAAILTQLKAGNIHYYQVRPEDILSIKREEPRLQIYQSDFLSTSMNRAELTFGQLPDGKSPFLDERVRQAYSMSWDRDAYLDVFHNVTKLKSEGLPVSTRWNSVVGSWWEGWWLDPKSSEFGPNAKFFQHDIAEAKKLLSAAGYPSGLKTTSTYVAGPELYRDKRMFEVLDNMAAEAGLVSTPNPVDYNTVYIPKIRDASGQWEGWAVHSIGGGGPATISPVAAVAGGHWSRSTATFKGYSASGKNDKSGDPMVDDLIAKARLEQDPNKAKALINDLQRYMAKAMWGLIMPGAATEFTMAWPALSNYQTYHSSSPTAATATYRWWLDQTKAPFV